MILPAPGRRLPIALASVVLPIALGLGACKQTRSQPAPGTPPEPTAANRGGTLATSGDPVAILFEAAGRDGTLGIAVWPARWSELGRLTAALAGEVSPPLAAELDGALGALTRHDTAWAAFAAIWGQLGGPALPADVPGLAGSRPIVASLAAPIGAFEEVGLAVAELLAARGAASAPPPAGLRHRIILPADDSAALATALIEALARAGDLEARPASGAMASFASESLLIRITTAKLWVGVDVAAGWSMDRLDDDALDALVTAGPSAGPADRLFAATDPAVVRLHLRHRILGELGPQWGMRMVGKALALAATEHHVPWLMQGYAEVLGAFLVMDPAGAVASDLLVEVPIDPPGGLHAAVLLTAGGTAAFAADPKLAAGEAIPAAEVSWAAVASRAPMPPIFATADGLAGAAEQIVECGTLCAAYAAGGNGLSLLRLAAAAGPDAAARLADEVLGHGGDGASRAVVSLAGSLLVIEALGAAESRFRNGSPPAADAAPSEADRCYREALLHLRRHLAMAAQAAPGAIGQMLPRARREQGANLACARGEPATAARVERLLAALDRIEQLAAAPQ